MKRTNFLRGIIFVAGLCGLPVAPAQQQPLKLVQKIPLPRSFEGCIDHQSVDVRGNRYFLSGLSNGTVEVIDLASGKVFHAIPGFTRAQAALYVPEAIFLVEFNSHGGEHEKI